MLDLFADAEPAGAASAGAVILRRFALSRASALLAGIRTSRPFRHSDIW